MIILFFKSKINDLLPFNSIFKYFLILKHFFNFIFPTNYCDKYVGFSFNITLK